jgi:hypothetical protein
MAGLGKIVGNVNPSLTSFCVKARYDFATHGGAVSVIGLGVVIPKGAIITRCIGSAITAFLNPATGATIALDCGTQALNAATPFDHVDYTAVDVHYSTPVALTADGEITFTIAATALTQGVYDIYVEYLN